MATLIVGTDAGLLTVSVSGTQPDAAETLARTAPRESIRALGRSNGEWSAISGGHSILHASPHDGWKQIATTELEAQCVALHSSGLLVGTSQAHLLRLRNGGLEPVTSFEDAGGRDTWYTPWGGPPDTRSISIDGEGTVYVNVHVGGVLRSSDDGKTWEPTMDIDMDVHQVLADPSRAGLVFAASARGLGITEDGGRSWTFVTDGLHRTYCRAVALCEDSVLVSASSGPRGGQAGIYRRTIGGPGGFERCRVGLPEWFQGNIDTFCLAAQGETAAFGTEEGRIYVSEDQGRTWSEAAEAGAPVECLALL